jgi:hypothetical protein
MKLRLKLLEEIAIELDEERKKLQWEINNDPTQELIELHLEFNDWLKNTEGKNNRTSDENLVYIRSIECRKKQAEKRRRTYNSNKLISKLVEIDSEIQEVNNQIYSLKQKLK